MKRSCATCNFLKPDERPEYPDHGHCRRLPPQLVGLLYDGITASLEQHFPWMTPDDWCGEYAPTPGAAS